MDFKAKEGQDIFDLSIQLFGGVEAGVFALLSGNDLKLDSSNLGGKKIALNNNNDGDKKVISFFSNNNFTPTNSGFEVSFVVLGDFNDDFNNDFLI